MAETDKDTIFDVIIVGGGPAGITAAIYATRAALSVACIENQNYGGKINLTTEIDNYPAFDHITGAELAARFHQHAEACGTIFIYDSLTSIEKWDDLFVCKGFAGEYRAKTLIYAAGNSPKTAGFTNEDKFTGRGVSYCATCDGAFYKGKTAFVVGGGDAACIEADLLTHYADKVVLVVRKDHFKAKKTIEDKVRHNDKIEIRFNTSIVEVSGDTLPDKIVFTNNETGEITTYEGDAGSFGIFVFVGNQPNSQLIAHLVELDSIGAVMTDERMATKTEGLYIAGDVRHTVLRQIVTASSDGAVAATEVALYLGFVRDE